MNTIKMVALKEFTYANRALKAGDPFDADNRSDAHVLEVVGHARPDAGEPKKYRRRDMRAEG